MVAKAVESEITRSGSTDAEALVRDQEQIKGDVLGSLPGGLVEAMSDVPFSQLCNDGSAITRANFLVKLWRYCFAPLKQLYLPFITSNMPTNFLMVSCIPESSSATKKQMLKPRCTCPQWLTGNHCTTIVHMATSWAL
jgi:hypothetical protein